MELQHGLITVSEFWNIYFWFEFSKKNLLTKSLPFCAKYAAFNFFLSESVDPVWLDGLRLRRLEHLEVGQRVVLLVAEIRAGSRKTGRRKVEVNIILSIKYCTGLKNNTNYYIKNQN